MIDCSFLQYPFLRVLINMMPIGAHMISRNSILAAKLPSTFTTKSNWRGPLPRDVLCAFCRSHHLSEPVFHTSENNLPNSPVDSDESNQKLKSMESDKGGPGERNGVFYCEVKIFSKTQELIMKCSPQESFRKQTNAIQTAALKILSWLDIYFEEPRMSLEKLNAYSETFDIQFTPSYYFKVFELCPSVHESGSTKNLAACGVVNFNCTDSKEDEPYCGSGGECSGVTLSNGSLACISYSVSLVTEGESTKEDVESCEEFEFEVGNEAVVPHLEAAVIQLVVGQSATFRMELPPSEFILAAARNSASVLSFLSSSKTCMLIFYFRATSSLFLLFFWQCWCL